MISISGSGPSGAVGGEVSAAGSGRGAIAEEGGEGAIFQVADSGDDARGVQISAVGVGVGVVELGEEFLLDVIGHDAGVFGHDEGVEGDEEAVGLFGDGFGVGDVAVLFGLARIDGSFGTARDGGADDGGHAFGFGIGDVFAHVPAVGVDGFFFAVVGAEGEGDIFGFFADAADGAAFAVVAGEGAAVVVAHLDEDEVAGLGVLEDSLPQAFGLIGA